MNTRNQTYQTDVALEYTTPQDANNKTSIRRKFKERMIMQTQKRDLVAFSLDRGKEVDGKHRNAD